MLILVIVLVLVDKSNYVILLLVVVFVSDITIIHGPILVNVLCQAQTSTQVSCK